MGLAREQAFEQASMEMFSANTCVRISNFSDKLYAIENMINGLYWSRQGKWDRPEFATICNSVEEAYGLREWTQSVQCVRVFRRGEY